MMRAILAVVAGLVVWTICATAFDVLLRLTLPGYATAEPHLQFTLGMMVARLALPGAIPSVAAGYTAAWIARGAPRVVTSLAIVLVLLFAPSHYHFWSNFPLWYHLTFLVSLVLLTWCGAELQGLVVRRRMAVSPA